MPIYEYRCAKCGEFEAMQKMSDKPLTQCPTCRRKVTKLISSTSFQLKGSGWYITDYARKQGGAAKPAKKADESAAASDTGTAKSDTGSSAKTESTSSAEKKTTDKPAAA